MINPNPYYTLYNRVNHFHLLNLAERLINDNEPTVAMFTDPKDEVFNQPITTCTK